MCSAGTLCVVRTAHVSCLFVTRPAHAAWQDDASVQPPLYCTVMVLYLLHAVQAQRMRDTILCCRKYRRVPLAGLLQDSAGRQCGARLHALLIAWLRMAFHNCVRHCLRSRIRCARAVAYSVHELFVHTADADALGDFSVYK
eukprot:IDg15109t1